MQTSTAHVKVMAFAETAQEAARIAASVTKHAANLTVAQSSRREENDIEIRRIMAASTPEVILNIPRAQHIRMLAGAQSPLQEESDAETRRIMSASNPKAIFAIPRGEHIDADAITKE